MSAVRSRHDMENELAADMLSGSRESFNRLYQAYAPALMGYISKLTGDQRSAEEALQKTFVEIWNNRHSYDPSSERLFTWLLKITKSIAIGFIPANRYLTNKWARTTFSHNITDDRMPDTGAADETSLELQEQLLHLMHYNNYSIEEASAILKVDEKTIRAALRTAISKLKTA